MKTIHKFAMTIGDVKDAISFSMPEGARPLHVANQNGDLCIWALVDPSLDVANVERKFLVCGTGHPVMEPAIYIGTAHFNSGMLVLHVFDPTGATFTK